MTTPGVTAPERPAGAGPSAPARRLSDVLVASLEELAAAGRVEAACRLAGQAYATLRRSDREAARRFDVLLHRLTRRLSW